MANRAGFEVRDSLEGRAGDVSTSVVSSGATSNISVGPEIGMRQTEGEQIAGALSRFAPAGSKLLIDAYQEVKQKKEREGAIDQATKQGMRIPNDSDYVRGHNALAATEAMSNIALQADAWSKANPEASAEEFSAHKIKLFNEARPEFEKYGVESRDMFDSVFIKQSAAVDALHTKRVEAVRTDKAIRQITATTTAQLQELKLYTPGTPEYETQIGLISDVVKTAIHNPIAGIADPSKRIKAIAESMVLAGNEGDDTLLKIIDDDKELRVMPEFQEAIQKTSRAVTTIRNKITSEEDAAEIAAIHQGVEDGTMSLAEYTKRYNAPHLNRYTHSTEKWLNMNESGAKKRAIEEYDYTLKNAAIAGKVDDYDPPAEKRSKALTEGYKWIRDTQSPEEAIKWAVKYGYELPIVHREMTSYVQAGVDEAGNMNPRALSAYNSFKAAATAKNSTASLNVVYGEAASAAFSDIMVLEKAGLTPGLALKKRQENTKDPEIVKHNIKAFLKSTEDMTGGGWFGTDIKNPADIQWMQETGIAAMRSGLVGTPEGAAAFAKDKFMATHTLIGKGNMGVTNQFVAGTKAEVQAKLSGGQKVPVDPDIALRTFASDSANQKKYNLKGIDPGNITLWTAPNSNVVHIIDNTNPDVGVLKGTTTWEDIGKIHTGHALTKRKDTWNAVARNRTEAQESEFATASSAIGSLIVGDEAMTYVGVKRGMKLNGLSKDDVGYTIAEWRNLPKDSKVGEIARLYSLAEARHLGYDTKPFENPILYADPKKVNVDNMMKAIMAVEVPGRKGEGQWIRTTATGKPYSAYGPGQMTFETAKTAAADPSYGLTDAEKRWVAERYVPQGEMFHKHGDNVSTTQYGPGGKGTLQKEERPIYMSVMKKIVTKYMKDNNNDPKEVLRAWNQGPNSKKYPTKGYLKLAFSNL